MEERQSLISKMDLAQILTDANVPRNTKEIFVVYLVRYTRKLKIKPV